MMKLRKQLPLLLFAFPLLLFVPPLLVAAEARLNNADIRALNHPPESNNVPVPTKKDSALQKLGVGTKDAPVDGLDGKPHAGPWVDREADPLKDTGTDGTHRAGAEDASSLAEKPLPTSLQKLVDSGASSEERWQLANIPEKNDGVMDDASRPKPKEGTTGTEGGVSEKAKERKAKGNVHNKPTEPKEAPPLPHSEEQHIESSEKRESKDAKKPSDIEGKKDGEYGPGGYGMEKPTDLPDTPHNIPHPDPMNPSLPNIEDSDELYDVPPLSGVAGTVNVVDTMPYTQDAWRRPGPAPESHDDDEGIIQPLHSFILSLTMILFSEIGDKTFLVAALMAMRHPRLVVFSAAWSALIAMTVLSAVLGHAVPALLPKRFSAFAAAALFLVFGLRMLREVLAMPKDSGVGEEMREVEAELEENEHKTMRRKAQRRSNPSPSVLESGRGGATGQNLPAVADSPVPARSPSPAGRSRVSNATAGLQNLCSLVLSPAWVQTFVMTFLGEWGDRSQIATIAMAAGPDYWLVTGGAIVGHAFCTGVAVVGGRALAGKVSLRAVTLGGAVAFLAFGVIYLFEAFHSD